MTTIDRYILVVEDNVAMGNLLSYILRDAGFTVTAATNGHEAWEALQSTQFDLVITDYQMPELTGVELFERLRESERYADTPVIMITGKGLELRLPGMEPTDGFSRVFSKPFSPKEVVRAVADCLGLVAH